MTAMIKRFLSVNLLSDKITPEVLNLVVSPLNLQVTRITAGLIIVRGIFKCD